MKRHHLIAVILIILTFISSGAMAADAGFYKKAAATAAQLLSQYLNSPAKLVEQNDISCHYNILDQQGEAGKGSRTACSMYLTYYARNPHPHQGNFKNIASLPDKWSFKDEYGEKVCERKFAGNQNELIRIKANYVLPSKTAKVKMLRTMAFIDFYAGADRAGYFSFSINRNFPVNSETQAQLESKGHDLAVSDSEKIIEAIRAGLSGKSIERPPAPPVVNEPEKWQSLSPTKIVKTHLEKISEPVSSPIFASLTQIGNFNEVKADENLDLKRLRCMTAHEMLYSFASQRLNQTAILFVGIAKEKAVVFTQLADGQIAFSPALARQEALAEACNMAAQGLPNHWLTFSNQISPQEQMVLRALSTLSQPGKTLSSGPGFSLGQIMLEMGNPVHASSIGLMPEASRNTMFAATLNRNDIAIALLKLRTKRLIKRSYLAEQHYFSLTTDGNNLCSLFAADNQAIIISWQKKSVKGEAKSVHKLAIFAKKDLAVAIYLSQSGDIFSGLGNITGNIKMAPAQVMLNLLKTWQ